MSDLIDARARFAALAKATTSQFRAEVTDRAATVHLYGIIGDEWDGVDATATVRAIRALDADTITAYVNSPGGDVFDGLSIANALRTHPAAVTVIVDGLAASAATIIACAADEVVMSAGSQYMIHDAWGIAIGNADRMRVVGAMLDRTSAELAGWYAQKAGGTADEWRERMRAETWYTADEAVAAGLADRADSLQPAARATFDLSMFAHAGRAAAGAPTPVAALAHNREDTPQMDPITQSMLDEQLDMQRAELERTFQVAIAGMQNAAPDPGPSWPTFGHFLKALVGGDDRALAFYEQRAAYDGATTADDKQPNTWVRDAIHLIQRTRKVLGSFSTEPLPGDGLTLEYLELKSNSIAVAKQATQGADLVKGKVQLDSKTTKVDTYGGWTELTRQIIDRASAQYLTTANTAMTIEYARATEQVIRDLLKAIIAAQLAGTPALSIAATATAYEWLDLIVDAGMLFDDLGYSIDKAFVSVDVFKKLIRLEDTNGNSLMRVWGTGVNQVGEIDLTGVEGNLASVRFQLLPGAEANTLEFHDRLGITTWESPGAPFRLQDSNIVNLTEAMSQYGYLAAASQFPGAIQAVAIV